MEKDKKILVIIGHPSKNSLCGALGEAYAEGAEKSGFEVKKIYLCELDFDLVLHEGYNKIQALEKDLGDCQEAIQSAEHIVLIYPIWWGTMPGIMKGFIDRVILPGFAFKYREGKSVPEKFLKGKSARIITTSGGPWVFYLFINPDRRLMKTFVLGFTGIKPVRKTHFGSIVKDKVDEERAKKIINKVKRLGQKGI